MDKNLKYEITKYVEDNIGVFHEKRLESIDSLRLNKVLSRKNPYLFKAKYVLTSQQIIKGFVDAHISSSEEGIFGDWLEGLAIFINQKTHSGRKSGITGIDLEFDKNNTRYIITIKSGPNWGNDGQVKKMIDNFDTARKTLRTSGAKTKIVSILGCCYGKSTTRNIYKKKGDYYKYCGQLFWKFISGYDNLYIELIEPLGKEAKEKNDDFIKMYSRKINVLTLEFGEKFCKSDGEINWEKLVEFNSMSRLQNKS